MWGSLWHGSVYNSIANYKGKEEMPLSLSLFLSKAA